MYIFFLIKKLYWIEFIKYSMRSQRNNEWEWFSRSSYVQISIWLFPPDKVFYLVLCFWSMLTFLSMRFHYACHFHFILVFLYFSRHAFNFFSILVFLKNLSQFLVLTKYKINSITIRMTYVRVFISNASVKSIQYFGCLRIKKNWDKLSRNCFKFKCFLVFGYLAV